MELRLKGYGTIEITNATLVEGGDILIEASDNFREIAKATEYEVTEVYLTETEYGWGLVAFLNLSDNDWYSNESIVIDVENQHEIYKLNAFL